MSEWYHRWRVLPDDQRNTMRTYTVRAVRNSVAEVDIDFVLHGDAGPASAWAMSAQPGAQLVIVGPDKRVAGAIAGGVEWRPGTAQRVLIAGDETAAPAICSILEALPGTISGLALIEVPSAADALPLEPRSGVEIRWLARESLAHGVLLRQAVEQWGKNMARTAETDTELPDPDPAAIVWEAPVEETRQEYAWLAGESGVITDLRRYLVKDLGVERSDVAFMGYWRQGRAEN